MMDRERLNHLMQDPSAVQRQDIADLKAMTERYPWFSGAHLLLAVGDHASGDVLFDEQLRTTAAHLPSRAVLFDLVHAEVEEPTPVRMSVVPPTPLPPVAARSAPPPVQEAQPPVVVAERAEIPVIAPEPAPEVQVAAPVVIPEPVAVVEEPAPVIEEKVEEVVVESLQPAEEEVEEEEERSPEAEATGVQEEEIGKPKEVQEADPLDKQIRNAALASGYALVMEHTPLPPPSVPEEPAGLPTVAAAREHAPVAGPAIRDRMRFTDWLSVEAPQAIAPAPPVPEAIPLRGIQREIAPATVPAPPTPSTTDTRSLIERFIQQSVQAAPAKKAEFFTPQLAGKRSLEDHADLVSETLAKVYEAQGNYSKALAAYQRLALKHPDKSTYFAALSKAVEAKMSK